jgi:hypothetical protein
MDGRSRRFVNAATSIVHAIGDPSRVAVAFLLVLTGCAGRDSDEASTYTRADLQRAFQTQGIKLVALDMGGQQYLLQDGYRDAVSVWVRPPGSPDEFGISIRLNEGHKLVTAENAVITYDSSQVPERTIARAVAALKRQKLSALRRGTFPNTGPVETSPAPTSARGEIPIRQRRGRCVAQRRGLGGPALGQGARGHLGALLICRHGRIQDVDGG